MLIFFPASNYYVTLSTKPKKKKKRKPRNFMVILQLFVLWPKTEKIIIITTTTRATSVTPTTTITISSVSCSIHDTNVRKKMEPIKKPSITTSDWCGVVEVAFAKGRKGHTHMKCIHTYITVLLPVVNLFNGKYDEESGPRDENVCDVLVCEYMCVRMACERARACP